MTHKTQDRTNAHRAAPRRNEQEPGHRPAATQPKAPKKAPTRKLKLPAYVRHA